MCAAGTLKPVARIWKKPVHLLTLEEGQAKELTSDRETIKASDAVAPGAKPGSEAG
ncbi:MAG: hypothetical protein HZA53_06020 [Planctomycetes bacterium]|nr:hypothetical protein [Planctomycetota bacterium]